MRPLSLIILKILIGTQVFGQDRMSDTLIEWEQPQILSEPLQLSEEAPTISVSTTPVELPSPKSMKVEKMEFSVGLHTGQFEYQEPGLMTDSARLKGFNIQAHLPVRNHSHALMTANYEELSGPGLYEGSLWDGTPIKSDTQNSVKTLQGVLGYQNQLDEQTLVRPFLGLGIRNLVNTQSGEGAYKRASTYNFMPIGIEWTKMANKDLNWGLQLEYNVFLDGKVKSHFSDVSPDYPDIESRQNLGYGYRVIGKIKWTYNNLRFQLEPFYHFWKIEDSDRKKFSDDFLVFEPANQTKLTGANFLVAF